MQVQQVQQQQIGRQRPVGPQQQPPSPFSPQAPQSPHDYPQSPAQQQQQQQQQTDHYRNSYDTSQSGPTTPTSYSNSPRATEVFQPGPGNTPRPVFNVPATRAHVYAPTRTLETAAYALSHQQQHSQQQQQHQNQQIQPQQQPSSVASTSSPVGNYMSPRSDQRSDLQSSDLFSGQQPEVNLQLRDLLQRQQQFGKELKPINQSWGQGTLFFYYLFFNMNLICIS